MKLDLQILFAGTGLVLFIPFLIGFSNWNLELIIPIMVIQIIMVLMAVKFYHSVYDTKKGVIIYE